MEDNITALESVDLTPILDAIEELHEVTYTMLVGQVLSIGILLGMMIIFVLAVMFHDW